MTSTAKFVPSYYEYRKRECERLRMYFFPLSQFYVSAFDMMLTCGTLWTTSIHLSTYDFSSHNMNQTWTREVAPKWYCKTYREVLSHIGRASGTEGDQYHTLYTAAHGVSAAGILPFSMIRGPSAKKWGFWLTHIRVEEKFLPNLSDRRDL